MTLTYFRMHTLIEDNTKSKRTLQPIYAVFLVMVSRPENHPRLTMVGTRGVSLFIGMMSESHAF